MKLNFKLCLLLVVFLHTFILPFSKEEFNAIVTRNKKNYPSNFNVTLKSPFIKNQINKNIPRDKIKFNSKPYLSFIFEENKRFDFVLKNVSEFYESFFNGFLAIFKKSGFLFGLEKDTNSYEKITKKYRIKNIDSKDKLYKKYSFLGYDKLIKVTDKKAIPGDYALYFFNKEFDISYSEYFEDNKKVSHIIFFYSLKKKRKIVKKIEVFFNKKNAQSGTFQVEFLDYSFLKKS